MLQNPLDLILEQIDMVLDTSRKDVLGELDYGSDLEKYLYDLRATNSQIERDVYQTISNSCDLFGCDLGVKVYITDGTIMDIIMVKIDIVDTSGNHAERVYRLS